MEAHAKIVILIGDGMADHPLASLGGRTVLEAAQCPNMDAVARAGAGGLIETVGEGLYPGSDIAIMSILGYDPREYYTGRGPLEAAAAGIDQKQDEVCFRCNLVTVEDGVMADYSGGHLSTDVAHEYIAVLKARFDTDGLTFHPGVSYRHLACVTHALLGGDGTSLECAAPHDILGEPIGSHLARGEGSAYVRALTADAGAYLAAHEVVQRAHERGAATANAIWLWGQGARPAFPSFVERHALEQTAMITAVDLLRGLANLTGIDVINVPGATGYYDTNYAGKASAALAALATHECVIVHVEAPDEAGHNGDIEEKIRAIENFDRLVVGPVWRGLEAMGAYCLAVLPDHPTPVEVRTHVREKVPFALCGTGVEVGGTLTAFNERAAAESPWQDLCALELIDTMRETVA
jgi:2,3-bisphosphoglycerate-independent phosphoglycerate mutase